LPYYGTEVSPGDHPPPPSHYFGVHAVGVNSAAGLERELRKALAADGPTIIEAAVDGAHYSQTVYD
jgi:thiamine pyrophosphate-dependent acetolactate synthase large subunit-like protein